MIKYIFKDGPVLIKNIKAADPQQLGEAIAAIKVANGGVFKPEDGWKAAVNRRHPLHRHIEWNKDKAAYAYQLEQIREICRCIRIEPQNENDEPMPAFINIALAGGPRGYYQPEDIVDNTALQLKLMEMAERELRAFQKRYAVLKTLCGQVGELAGKLAEDRMRLQARRSKHNGDEART